MMRRVYLLGRSGIHANEKFLLEDELIIGRNPQMCQMIYPASEKNISGIHCKLQEIDGKVCLIDLNSTNGTFFQDGTRLKPNMPRTMTDGQGFYLGSRENAFDLLMEEEEVQPVKKLMSESNVDIPAVCVCVLAVVLILIGFIVQAGILATAMKIGGIVLGTIGILRIRQLKNGEVMDLAGDKISSTIVIAAIVLIVITIVSGIFGYYFSQATSTIDKVMNIVDFVIDLLFG